MKEALKGTIEDKYLLKCISAIKKRIDRDWDIVIAIDGEEGVGKSTLAMIMGILLDKKFNLHNNIAYLPTHQEIEQKFTDLGSKQTFVVDEAIKAMYKMRFMDKLQTRINEMYATERWQNKVTILCIPRFTDLNEYFRNHRVKFWVHIIDRGLAIVFHKDDVNIFGRDPWHLKENEKYVMSKIKRKRFVEIENKEKINIYSNSQNFFFGFEYPDLPEKISQEYKTLKADYRNVKVKREEREVVKIIKKLKEENMTQRKIASIIGISEQRVGQLLNK